jgi:hypothetical protein
MNRARVGQRLLAGSRTAAATWRWRVACVPFAATRVGFVVGPIGECGPIEIPGFHERALEHFLIKRVVDAEIRIMLQHLAEYVFAVQAVPLCIQDVEVPYFIDLLRRHDLLAGVKQDELEEVPVGADVRGDGVRCGRSCITLLGEECLVGDLLEVERVDVVQSIVVVAGNGGEEHGFPFVPVVGINGE